MINQIFLKLLLLSSVNLQKNFIDDTKHCLEVNKNLLFNILNSNKNTLYGKRHKFSYIKSIDDYKKNVPLSDYSDFEEYIIAETNGKKNILTKENVEYFGHSSGTTGKQKILPITKTSRVLTIKLNGILCQKFVYDNFKDKWNYGKGAMLTDIASIETDNDKAKITSASSGGMSTIKKIVPYVWTSPVEIMELKDKDTAFYLHVLFALKEKKLMYVSGMFISSILDFFRFIEKNYDSLINDLKTGKISSKLKLDDKTRSILNKKLGKCEKRSNELKQIINGNFQNIALKIWPSLVYIGCVTGANFANYNDIVRYYIGNIPICSIAYAATEAFIGINPYYDKIKYVLIPSSCFFEFIDISDIDKPNPKTYLINELKINHSYEIVLTTINGLYRYRLADIVKVVSYYNDTPEIEFLYRKNQLLNMVAEKTTENHVKTALQNVMHKLNCRLIDYTTYADNSITPGRYLFYIEIEKFNSAHDISYIENMLDKELQNANPAYKRFRNSKRLKCLKIKIVKRGTFARLKESIVTKNTSINQLKIPRVIPDKNIIERML